VVRAGGKEYEIDALPHKNAPHKNERVMNITEIAEAWR
jgi:hypothetical protein